MNISILNGINYLKGLLILIRKDTKITAEEHQLIGRIGKNWDSSINSSRMLFVRSLITCIYPKRLRFSPRRSLLKNSS
jgi:hypothetical protein